MTDPKITQNKDRIEIEYSNRDVAPGETIVREHRFSAKAHDMQEVMTLISCFFPILVQNMSNAVKDLNKQKSKLKRSKKAV